MKLHIKPWILAAPPSERHAQRVRVGRAHARFIKRGTTRCVCNAVQGGDHCGIYAPCSQMAAKRKANAIMSALDDAMNQLISWRA